MNIPRFLCQDRSSKALTGLSVAELRHLAREFGVNLQAYSASRKPDAQEKENNRTISGIRVLSEHAIGGIKRMKAASETQD